MIFCHGEKAMRDVKRYIKNRVERDPEFAENYAVGYADFKIGVILRQAREAAGLTQEEVAQKLPTKKSAISRIENHAGDVRLSTIQRYAEAVGARLQIRFAHTRPWRYLSQANRPRFSPTCSPAPVRWPCQGAGVCRVAT